MAAGRDPSYPLETSTGILLNVPISRAQGHQPDPRRFRAEPRSRTCLFCDCYFFLWGVRVGGILIPRDCSRWLPVPGPRASLWLFPSGVCVPALGTRSQSRPCPQMAASGEGFTAS